MQDVYIVDGSRTPFVKGMGKPNPLSAADLAVSTTKSLLAKLNLPASKLDEVISGCVIPGPDEANIARIIALRIGCGDQIMGWTVQRNCASGLQAIDCGYKDIAIGRHNLVLAGGTEAMSKAPLLLSEDMVFWLASLQRSKTMVDKFKQILKFKVKFLRPVISLLQGLTDPVVGMNMGQTAEKLASQFNISRVAMDEFALSSHKKTSMAVEKDNFTEITPLFDWQGKSILADNGVRLDSTIEKLSSLKPVFEKPFGKVTAGNSSQISDGAAFTLLASAKALKEHNLSAIAKIKDIVWMGLDPSIMGLGPAYAIAELMRKNSLKIDQIDYWEINEAFAGQVLACVKALADEKYCKENFKLSSALGEINQDKLNIDGGAIAIGHPIGASGARLTLHLAKILSKTSTKYGIASLCIGGGQGGAILLENTALEGS